ncbi:metalloregulator ArsR/SmtB family transcription factor [Paenibacillus sp. FSL L8-0696]|uniref:ArsR/SmtB family transcription factor n=1 Tax=Paenibacillus sp. FSL L8-0696 TaxID=2954524 RepID=UPI003119A65C
MNQLTNIFKLLSDDTRLRMIVLLYQQELCVCQLSGILEVPQPRISKNLSKLRDLNIVVDDRKEKFVFYSLKTENKILTHTLENIIDTLNEYPQLVIDQDRLADKEKNLNQCSITYE